MDEWENGVTRTSGKLGGWLGHPGTHCPFCSAGRCSSLPCHARLSPLCPSLLPPPFPDEDEDSSDVSLVDSDDLSGNSGAGAGDGEDD
jgi:hypothetical protein